MENRTKTEAVLNLVQYGLKTKTEFNQYTRTLLTYTKEHNMTEHENVVTHNTESETLTPRSNLTTLIGQPLEVVLPNTYHVDEGEATITFYQLLQQTWEYIQKAPDPTPRPEEGYPGPTADERLEYIKALTDYYERIYNQCLNDNRDTQSIPREMAEVAELIYTNTKLNLEEFCKPLLDMTKGISKIYYQYYALLTYCRHYKEMIAHEIPDDTTNHAHYYKKYIAKINETYLPKLKDCTETISLLENRLDRKALYTLMFQMDSSIIDPHTEIKTLVALIRAVQNARLFRNRTNTIIGLRDTISLCNTIRIIWFLNFLNHGIAGIDNLQPNPDCEIGLDSEDPDAILSSLECINSWVDGATGNFEQGAELTEALKGLANSVTNKNRINSYLDLIDWVNDMINFALKWLKELHLHLNLLWLQKILDKLRELFDIIRGWLNNPLLQHLFNKFNKVIDMINKTMAMIQNLMCLIRQLLCVIGGVINFMATVIAPLLNMFKKMVDSAKGDFNATIDHYNNHFLTPIFNAARNMIAEQARGKLKARASQISAAMGQPLTENANVNKIIDASINSYLGKDEDDTGMLTKLKDSSRKAMLAQKDSFKSALSPANSMNCPPITFANLSMPNLSLIARLPGLTPLKLSILC